jgi:putative hydrolase of the HAD superfamily
MLRAVTLDFWNTLFVDHRGREREHRRAEWLRARLDELGAQDGGEGGAGRAADAALSDAAIADAVSAGFDYFERVWRDERRTPPANETTEAIVTALGVRLPEAPFARTVEYFERLILDVPPEPVAGAVGALATLAERYRLAVVCDTGYSPGSVLTELLARHGMLEPFSYLFFSNEHGMSKPDVRVFKHTLAQLGVRAGEAAHVGDMQRTDIAGAQAAGMAAVHFVGANDRDAQRSTADLIVRHFDELPAALGGLICPGC